MPGAHKASDLLKRGNVCTVHFTFTLYDETLERCANQSPLQLLTESYVRQMTQQILNVHVLEAIRN